MIEHAFVNFTEDRWRKKELALENVSVAQGKTNQFRIQNSEFSIPRESFVEKLEVFELRDLEKAELLEMFAGHLGVEQGKAFAAKMFDERDERDLRCVRR